ncbi:MAG: RNA polymerase sigma-70 factor [Bacteroidales bacterium]|nr:RNA polymerase sigma-70 factor [Bacteroidales bacterium]
MIHSDKQVFEKIKTGDIKSFESIFKKYYQMLCGFSCKYIHDMDKAEEIVQDLFYNLWDKRNDLVIHSSVKSYLFRSAYNNSINYLKHKAIENRYEKNIKESIPQMSSDASEELRIAEMNHIIEETLNALPERIKLVFQLNRFEGLKYHEIAERLSLSVKTIEANMTRALKLLRKNLKDYLETA